jgi:hypothetical protein
MIHGVPYLTNGTNKLFTYTPESPIELGTYSVNTDTTVTVNFKEGVIDSLKPTLESWRSNLKSRSRKVTKKEDTEDSDSNIE